MTRGSPSLGNPHVWNVSFFPIGFVVVGCFWKVHPMTSHCHHMGYEGAASGSWRLQRHMMAAIRRGSGAVNVGKNMFMQSAFCFSLMIVLTDFGGCITLYEPLPMTWRPCTFPFAAGRRTCPDFQVSKKTQGSDFWRKNSKDNSSIRNKKCSGACRNIWNPQAQPEPSPTSSETLVLLFCSLAAKLTISFEFLYQWGWTTRKLHGLQFAPTWCNQSPAAKHCLNLFLRTKTTRNTSESVRCDTSIWLPDSEQLFSRFQWCRDPERAYRTGEWTSRYHWNVPKWHGSDGLGAALICRDPDR